MNEDNISSEISIPHHTNKSISIIHQYRVLIGGLVMAISSTVWAQNRVVEIPKVSDFSLWESCTYVRNDNRGGNIEIARPIRTVVQWKDWLEFSDGKKNRSIEWDYIGRPESNGTWRKWPLKVWATWEYREDWKRADGTTVNTTQNVTVVWEEEVVTPAGKFQTFKIIYDGWYKTTNWGNGRQLDIYWYSPEAKADVKRMHDDRSNMYTQQMVECSKWESRQ